MEFLLACCVFYCVAMTIAIGFLLQPFSMSMIPPCFVDAQSNAPVSVNGSNLENVSLKWHQSIIFGFVVHCAGIISDGMMFLRVKRIKSRYFNFTAIICVTIYSCAFTAWLIYLMVVRFSHGGEVCSGHYMSPQDKGYESLPIAQGLHL